MQNDLMVWRQAMNQSMIDTMKNISALSSGFEVLTSRLDSLTNEMTDVKKDIKTRIYVSPAHKNILQKAVSNKVKFLTEKYCIDYKAGSKRIFQALWRSLKDKYSISVYSELPDVEFDNALEFIRTWEDEVFLKRAKDEIAV